jgi:multimeric flavodoxin WrbA
MKVLILDGCAMEAPTAAWLAEFGRARGWAATTLALRGLQIAPCTGCFGCWLRTPGECVNDDDGRDMLRQLVQSDGVILLTPVTFGGYSSLLKRALDRSIPMISPFFATLGGETHHRRRYAHHPRMAMLGLTADDNPEEEQVFRTLAARNALNFHEPQPAVAVVQANSSAADLNAALTSTFDAAGWK